MLYSVHGVFLDFETTGLLVSKAYPTQLAAAEFTIDTPKEAHLPIVNIKSTYKKIICPPTFEDCSQKALDIQGVTEEYLTTHGTTAYSAYREFVDWLDSIGMVKNDELLCSRMWAHNSDFDFGFLTKLHLMSKIEKPAPTPRNHINCSKKLYSSLAQFGITDPAVPDNLDKLSKHYGFPMENRTAGNIHDPLEDVIAGIHLLQYIAKDMRDYNTRLLCQK